MLQMFLSKDEALEVIRFRENLALTQLEMMHSITNKFNDIVVAVIFAFLWELVDQTFFK